MNETFALTVIPTVIRKGTNRLHLQFVTLYATDGVVMHRWTLRNTASYVEDFAGIIDRINAEDIVAQLRKGQTVLIHSLFDLNKIEKMFGEIRDLRIILADIAHKTVDRLK